MQLEEKMETSCALTQFSTMVTSYKTIVQYHNQDTDTVKTTFPLQKSLMLLPFYSNTYFPSTPSLSLNPDNH